MDVFNAITTRPSITKYTDEGVEREKLARLLEAARWAPSAGNMQIGEFIVVRDPDKKEKLSRYAQNQPHIREAPVVIVILADLEKAERRYGARGSELYAIQETAAGMQNLLLEAYNQELGAAWVGAFDEESVRNTLRIPERLRPVAIVTIGYPAQEPEYINKQRLTNIAYINTYGQRLKPIYDQLVWRGLREYKEQAKRHWERLKRKYS